MKVLLSKTILFSIFSFFIIRTYSQVPSIQWGKSFGGIGYDDAASIDVTTDGGYVITGSSSSNDGDVAGHHGSLTTFDGWVVKFDNAGVIQWQKSLGGIGDDGLGSIKQTSDGGYILIGNSNSNDGDVTAHHGSLTTADIWVIKLDNAGAIQWQKSLGGTANDYAGSIKEMPDGSFVLLGSSFSNDGDVSSHYGPSTKSDVWIAKLSNTGTLIWQIPFGGSGDESGMEIIPTNDGGCMAVAITCSSDGPLAGNFKGGYSDGLIIKINSSGIVQWFRCLGGNDFDQLGRIRQTSDSGYIILGNSISIDGDLLGTISSGFIDTWILKVDSTGLPQWTKLYGGSLDEFGNSVEITSDGYVFACTSYSNDFYVSGHHGSTSEYDFWIMKTDTSGMLQWQQSYGGTLEDRGSAIKPTSDGGYVMVGRTYSNDFDVKFNHGYRDAWVVKLSVPAGINEQSQSNGLSVVVYPNPSTGEFHFSGLENENKINVLDISGRVVFQTTTENNSYSLDLSKNSKGLYFYRVTNDKNESQTGKIVLQ